MIDLYYWPTPNGWKVSIMLEECALPYRVHEVDIGAGDQFKPEFLKISPNNRMPALIDDDPPWGGAPVSVFESGAMLEYLADKTGRFLAPGGPARYAALQWVHWQMANLGPMMGNANHFRNYAKNLVESPAELTYGTRRFTGEVDRLCGVMDAQLSAQPWLAGEAYSIADMAAWPWAILIGRVLDTPVAENFPNLQRWIDLVGARPAVQTGRNLHRDWFERPLTPEQEAARRALLFNQTNDKVRAAREAAARARAGAT